MANRITLISSLLFFLFAFSSFAEPMKFAYYDQYAPRSFSEDGQMKGILIDIVDEIIVKEMGIPVEHHGYPWSRAQAMVKSGRADAFVTVPTPDRMAYTIVNKEPVLTFETFLATAKNNPRHEELSNVKSISELKSFKLVDYLGNDFSKVVLKGMDVTWLPNYDSIFSFILQGKADAVLASRKAINTMTSLGYNENFTVFKNPLSSIKFYLCINKNSEYTKIIDEFDKILAAKKKQGIIENIVESYY
ncbi:MAG: hypothetical protein C0602_13075 [Denitrovibrio sp.]|nr:MAG: hypothetical protein C0602_13075 [Denitrovibrio sp.]